MIDRLSCWMFNHSNLYVKFDRKFLEKRRHKRLLKTSAALREATIRLNSPQYIDDPDATLW